MPNDPEKIEAFLADFTAAFQPWKDHVDRTPAARALADQAMAAVREQMEEFGLDPHDPVVMGAWVAAITFMPLAVIISEDFDDAIRMGVMIGLLGRVGG